MEIDEKFEKTLAHLFQIYKTLVQMLSDRGYIVSNEEKNMDLATFKETYRDKPSVREAMFSVHTSKHDPTDKIFIFVADIREDKSLSVEDIKATSEKMREKNVNRCIIVYTGKCTSHVKNAISLLERQYMIELFQENELLVNITQHRLVPQHVVLTNDQKKILLDKYKVNETQLPRILRDDPVARYFGLKRLQVVKIIRDSETAGRYVTYRIVW